jgi:hypothetical protein
MFFRSSGPRWHFAPLVTVMSAVGLFAATVGATTTLGVHVAAIHASPQVLTLSAGSPALSKLFSWADSAPGTTTTEYKAPDDITTVSETTIDVGPPGPAGPANAPCSPNITKAKGKLTSGGYIVIEGTCFGTSGKVDITGFPNGDPKVTIEAWTPTALTAQLPTISGVPNLTMHVKVTTGTLSSKTFDANYVAAIGNPLTLPNKYIVNNVCTLYGACTSAPHSPVGTHWDYSEQSGSDVWTLKIPDHFKLKTINLVHLTTGSTTTSTINSSPSESTFKVAWQEKLNGHVNGTSSQTQTTTCGSDFGQDLSGFLTGSDNSTCSTTTSGGTPIQIPTYNNVYRVEPQVVGPAGMTP